MQVVRKHHILEAVQWFELKDSPVLSNNKPVIIAYLSDTFKSAYEPNHICDKCGKEMKDHGWLNNGWKGTIICPGDILVKLSKQEYQVMVKDQFVIISGDSQ